MLRLYRVKVVLYDVERVTFEYYVLAEDEKEAELIVVKDMQERFELRLHDKFDMEEITEVLEKGVIAVT